MERLTFGEVRPPNWSVDIFDACMSMAVHLSDVETIGERVPFDPRPAGLDSR